MSDDPVPPAGEQQSTSVSIPAAIATPLALPPELEKLSPEIKSSMFSMMMGLIIRNTTGPDPETSKVVAQSEMHEETCRLEGYKEQLKNKDKQGERDHEFRKKQLNHDSMRNMAFYGICLVGICVGLYLLVAKSERTLGSNIVTACFVALLGGKSILGNKDKD
jgi:phosphotransferase system  glucose/maltose/N-acetylglucosamine-specific IIC component